jgi:hypothetical protein
MTHNEIRDAIIANGWQSLSAGEIAELLNVPKVVRGSFMASLGTPMKYLGAEAGAQLLETMSTLAESNAVVKWGLKLLERGELDLGLDSTRAMLDALLPPEAAAVLKGLAEQAVSANVTAQAVIDAMEGM